MKTNQFNITHSGWVLLCPIWLAFNGECPIPIPRCHKWNLWWWFDFNMWVYDAVINPLIGSVAPEAAGYVFWGIRPLKQTKIVIVEIPNFDN